MVELVLDENVFYGICDEKLWTKCLLALPKILERCHSIAVPSYDLLNSVVSNLRHRCRDLWPPVHMLRMTLHAQGKICERHPVRIREEHYLKRRHGDTNVLLVETAIASTDKCLVTLNGPLARDLNEGLAQRYGLKVIDNIDDLLRLLDPT